MKNKALSMNDDNKKQGEHKDLRTTQNGKLEESLDMSISMRK